MAVFRERSISNAISDFAIWAITALLAAVCVLPFIAVIAKSFAFIHKRNLVNEAVPYFVVADPDFHERVQDGMPVAIRPGEGIVELGGTEYRTEPVSDIALQIQAAGGVVPAVQRHGKDTFDVLTAGTAVG